MKLRCGVSGLGRGKLFVKILSALKDCQVVAACDPNPNTFSGLSGLATYTDYDAFLEEKLHLVAVISPGPLHAEQSLKALESGAHVLTETPCVYSLREARAVVDAVEKTGLKYMLAEDYIWSGWAVALRRMAQEGKFGEILYAEGDYTHDCRDFMLLDGDRCVPYGERHKHPGARKTWRATDLPPIQYCSHTLGPILRMIGDRVGSAYGLSLGGRAAPDLAPTDIESALLQTEKGAIVRLTNGFTVANPMSLYYNFVGTHGSAKIFIAGGVLAKWWTEVGERPAGWQDIPAERLQRPDGRSQAEVMVEEFIASILSDTRPPIDVYESMDMTLPGIVAHQSGLQGGVRLAVPDLRKRGPAG